MRILYFDIDSLRPDHLGCYGYNRNTSPTIDTLATEGRRFTNYYASDVPCLPSRTALFTGRFGIHTGVVNHGGLTAEPNRHGTKRTFKHHPDHRTFPSLLREAGYRTGFISSFPQRHGAWHVLDGFEEWRDPGGEGRETADEVVPHALDWLDAHATEDDWYLHVNVWDPHTPYNTPEEYENPFADEPAPAFPDAETIREQYESYGPHSAREPRGWTDGAEMDRTPGEISSRKEFEHWINGYDVGIRFMDDHLSMLLEALDEHGVREETLIIVSADHGENQGELNIYGDHQTADERTCNVPFIVSGPDVEPGVDDEFHYQVDFAPTLCELADIDQATGWDGESFAGSVADGDDVGREFIVCSQGAWAAERMVRWDDWLLIRTYHDGLKALDPVMLFDVAADPHETTNLAREHPDVARHGLSLLSDWVDERLLESATGVAGGNPSSPGGVTDPLWEVVRDGGPFHANGHAEAYADRLRETGREEHAETVLAHGGIVEQTAADYLDGE
ncbi:sulfatase [halophilic archaeon]|nr:sulfatase [halophilic archaeon]